MMKLQRAKEQNDRLDAENRALRERVRTIESEKKNLQEQVDFNFMYLLEYKFGNLQKRVTVTLHSLLCFFQLTIIDADQDVVAEEDRKEKSISSEPQNNLSALSAQGKDHIHKR